MKKLELIVRSSAGGLAKWTEGEMEIGQSSIIF